MTEKWQIFEQIVKEIFTSRYEKFPIRIFHNLLMQGKSTKHKIDVYVEVSLPTVSFKQIINAKYWSNNVPKKEVSDIIAIKDDLNVHNGIIVSKKGFQSGAVQLAKGNGIQLLKVLEPSEMKVKKAISLNIMKYPEVTHFNIELEPPNPSDVGKEFIKNYDKDYNKGTNLYDSSGNVIDNINNILDFHLRLALKSGKDRNWFNYTKVDPPLFQKIDGRMEKIRSFNMEILIREKKNKKEIILDDSKLLIHDLTNDSMIVINKPYNYDLLN
ncbi:MAG: restriction endonuclease [Candidatus Aenigmarchaeota archaeon]|nr:restriction endonuclease [Candidatus Aenigmarchaeota archaeon]